MTACTYASTTLTNLAFYSSFVDRDMLMRYHFGLGIGHVYAWSNQAIGTHRRRGLDILETLEEDENDEEVPAPDQAISGVPDSEANRRGERSNAVGDMGQEGSGAGAGEESNLKDLDSDEWEDSDEFNEGEADNYSDDDEFYSQYEMYY